MQFIKILAAFILISSSIYNTGFNNNAGSAVSMSSFEGKLVLVVNIATGSDKVAQLGGLQQLKQQYGDSLVIIGFPSNSFGHESRSDAEIKSFCENNYGVTFLLAAKASVSGEDIQPVYNWLTKQSENGVMNYEVGGDFKKYLIDQSGNLVGVFSGAVSPSDNQIIAAITDRLN